MSESRWAVVEAVLDFVMQSEPCTGDDWPVLEGLLDRLAAAVPRAAADRPDCAQQLPEHDQQAWREMVGRRFPDAVDDLLQIALELDRASWCRRHGSAHDGERYLSSSFAMHWGRHLRDLQSYLHRMLYGR